mgnify:FL=1
MDIFTIICIILMSVGITLHIFAFILKRFCEAYLESFEEDASSDSYNDTESRKRG